MQNLWANMLMVIFALIMDSGDFIANTLDPVVTTLHKLWMVGLFSKTTQSL